MLTRTSMPAQCFRRPDTAVLPASGYRGFSLEAGEYKFFDEFHENTGQGRLVAR